MLDYYYAGGPQFMSLITIAGIAAIGFAVKILLDRIAGRPVSGPWLNSIPITGSMAFMLGILAQTIGLYQAMSAIQAAGDVSPALLAGGFQVSLIAPIYGMIIFVITLIFWLGFALVFTSN